MERLQVVLFLIPTLVAAVHFEGWNPLIRNISQSGEDVVSQRISLPPEANRMNDSNVKNESGIVTVYPAVQQKNIMEQRQEPSSELKTGSLELEQPKLFTPEEPIIGSHLRLHKAADNQIGIRGVLSEKERTARNAFVRNRTKKHSKRGQFLRQNDDLNISEPYMNGVDNTFTLKYALGDRPEDVAERYTYNDFNGKDRAKKLSKLQRSGDRHNHMPVQRVRDRSSCRQYLEFLRYAFHQLDQQQRMDDDAYSNNYNYQYYYVDDRDDDDYDYAGGSRTSYNTLSPPMITPNLALLRSVGYTIDEAPPVKSTQITEKKVEENWTQSNATPSPLVSVSPSGYLLLPESETEATLREESMVVVPVTEYQSSMKTAYHPGMIQQRSETKDNCQDKLFRCPDNVNVTYPVNGFCNRFVVCESGKPNSEFCQDGLHYNLVTRECDLPHNSFCTYSCPKAEGFFGVPGDCEGFFRCTNWFPEYRLCPPKMHWDVKAKICTFEELSSCPLKCDNPYQVKPYNGVCNAYIICTKGKPSYHQCPSGYNFDKSRLRCVHKSKTKCAEDVDFIARNRGMENGRKKLCAKVELVDGKSTWCQEPTEDDE